MSISELWRCHAQPLWAAMQRQRGSFWFLCFYLVIEYIRPQQVYPVIDFAPWGKIALGGTILLFFFEGGSLRVKSPANWLMLAYTAVVLASIAIAYSPQTSINNLEKWYYWLIIYFLIVNIVNSEERYLLFLLVYFTCNLKMSQSGFRSFAMDGFHFRDWGVSGSPGWFGNSGEFGVEMCVFFPMSFYAFVMLWKKMKKPTALIFGFMPFSAIFVIIASSSRGAQVGVAASILWMLLKSPYKFRALVACAVLVPGLYFFLPDAQIQRFREAGDDKTSQARLTYWKHGREIIKANPVLGIGFDNWLIYYRARYNKKGEVSHNIFIQCAAELGLLGGAVLLSLILITFYLNYRTRVLARPLGDNGRLYWGMAHGMDAALIGFLVSGFFVTVLYYPFMWINLSFTVALNTVAQEAVRRAAGRSLRPVALPQPSRKSLGARPTIGAPAFARNFR